MVLSGRELFDLVVMSAAIGYIFMDYIPRQRSEPLEFVQRSSWDDFIYAVAAVAPSIVLHEMAHKFTALYYGLEATFHAAYTWLGIGVVLKLLNFGFIFFVPGYVSMSGQGAAWTFALIAFMGPLMHLVLWQGARWYLRNADAVTEAQSHYLGITLQINKFLFILNMIPIPGFDGYHVFSNLLGFIA